MDNIPFQCIEALGIYRSKYESMETVDPILEGYGNYANWNQSNYRLYGATQTDAMIYATFPG